MQKPEEISKSNVDVVASSVEPTPEAAAPATEPSPLVVPPGAVEPTSDATRKKGVRKVKVATSAGGTVDMDATEPALTREYVELIKSTIGAVASVDGLAMPYLLADYLVPVRYKAPVPRAAFNRVTLFHQANKQGAKNAKVCVTEGVSWREGLVLDALGDVVAKLPLDTGKVIGGVPAYSRNITVYTDAIGGLAAYNIGDIVPLAGVDNTLMFLTLQEAAKEMLVPPVNMAADLYAPSDLAALLGTNNDNPTFVLNKTTPLLAAEKLATGTAVGASYDIEVFKPIAAQFPLAPVNNAYPRVFNPLSNMYGQMDTYDVPMVDDDVAYVTTIQEAYNDQIVDVETFVRFVARQLRAAGVAPNNVQPMTSEDRARHVFAPFHPVHDREARYASLDTLFSALQEALYLDRELGVANANQAYHTLSGLTSKYFSLRNLSMRRLEARIIDMSNRSQVAPSRLQIMSLLASGDNHSFCMKLMSWWLTGFGTKLEIVGIPDRPEVQMFAYLILRCFVPAAYIYDHARLDALIADEVLSWGRINGTAAVAAAVGAILNNAAAVWIDKRNVYLQFPNATRGFGPFAGVALAGGGGFDYGPSMTLLTNLTMSAGNMPSSVNVSLLNLLVSFKSTVGFATSELQNAFQYAERVAMKFKDAISLRPPNAVGVGWFNTDSRRVLLATPGIISGCYRMAAVDLENGNLNEAAELDLNVRLQAIEANVRMQDLTAVCSARLLAERVAIYYRTFFRMRTLLLNASPGRVDPSRHDQIARTISERVACFGLQDASAIMSTIDFMHSPHSGVQEGVLFANRTMTPAMLSNAMVAQNGGAQPARLAYVEPPMRMTLRVKPRNGRAPLRDVAGHWALTKMNMCRCSVLTTLRYASLIELFDFRHLKLPCSLTQANRDRSKVFVMCFAPERPRAVKITDDEDADADYAVEPLASLDTDFTTTGVRYKHDRRGRVVIDAPAGDADLASGAEHLRNYHYADNVLTNMDALMRALESGVSYPLSDRMTYEFTCLRVEDQEDARHLDVLSDYTPPLNDLVELGLWKPSKVSPIAAKVEKLKVLLVYTTLDLDETAIMNIICKRTMNTPLILPTYSQIKELLHLQQIPALEDLPPREIGGLTYVRPAVDEPVYRTAREYKELKDGNTTFDRPDAIPYGKHPMPIKGPLRDGKILTAIEDGKLQRYLMDTRPEFDGVIRSALSIHAAVFDGVGTMKQERPLTIDLDFSDPVYMKTQALSVPGVSAEPAKGQPFEMIDLADTPSTTAAMSVHADAVDG